MQSLGVKKLFNTQFYLPERVIKLLLSTLPKNWFQAIWGYSKRY